MMIKTPVNWRCFSIVEKNIDDHIYDITKMYNDYRETNPVSTDIMKRIILSDSYIFWVVTDDTHKDLYGFLMFNKSNTPSYGEIELIYVNPDVRDCKVGEFLLKRVNKYCWRNGITTQILYRDITNVRLHLYYKRHGFKNYPIQDGDKSVKMFKHTDEAY